MVQRDTLRIVVCALLGTLTLAAQDWRRVGNSNLLMGLAGPASGPVERVWFAPGGGVWVRTTSGNTFETKDLDGWEARRSAEAPVAQNEVESHGIPRGATSVRGIARRSATVYALGTSVWRSDDEGATWLDLVRLKQGASILGEGFFDLAIDPGDSNRIALAASTGVWMSVDGGMTWTSLNEGLPNLPVRRIVLMARGSRGLRMATENGSGWEWMPGQRLGWMPAPESSLAGEKALRESLRMQVGGEVSAIAFSGDYYYAGLSDGRVAVSVDQRRTWRVPAEAQTAGSITRIWLDSADPRTALAVSFGGRVLRTLNAGLYWDDLTANLPDGPLYGVAADRATGAVYIAGAKGIFTTTAELRVPAPSTPWTKLASGWPESPVHDVALDEAGNQLYVAVEGYGVYARTAPHRARRPLVVHTADYSARAAAPGALLSLVGARATAVTAGGRQAPVLSASDAESQIQVPFEAQGDALRLVFGDTLAFTVPLHTAAPAILVDREGTPMLLDGDAGVQLDALRAARAGMRVQVLATGLGRVQPDWPTGLAAPLDNPPAVIIPVRAFLDGNPVAVTRATLAPGYIGFYLVELELPALVDAGASELWLEVAGQASNRVRLYVAKE